MTAQNVKCPISTIIIPYVTCSYRLDEGSSKKVVKVVFNALANLAISNKSHNKSHYIEYISPQSFFKFNVYFIFSIILAHRTYKSFNREKCFQFL